MLYAMQSLCIAYLAVSIIPFHHSIGWPPYPGTAPQPTPKHIRLMSSTLTTPSMTRFLLTKEASNTAMAVLTVARCPAGLLGIYGSG